MGYTTMEWKMQLIGSGEELLVDGRPVANFFDGQGGWFWFVHCPFTSGFCAKKERARTRCEALVKKIPINANA